MLSWVLGLSVVGLSYAIHYSLARSVVDPSSTYTQFRAGGLAWVLNALRYATDHLGSGGWFALALAALGLLGAALIPELQLRLLVLLSTTVPLAAFLFVANTAVDDRTGITKNYWGAAVVPLLYACIPFVFALLPGALVSRSAGARDIEPGLSDVSLDGGSSRAFPSEADSPVRGEPKD